MKLTLSKDLTLQKEEAQENIDNQAGTIRMKFITRAPGQDMVYQEKREEARLVLSGETYVLSDIPHVASEAQAEGVSINDKAEEIMSQSSLWKTVSAVIETKRLTAKAAVRAAQSEQAIMNATLIDWSEFA